mgnify:CR=1 FL=1
MYCAPSRALLIWQRPFRIPAITNRWARIWLMLSVHLHSFRSPAGRYVNAKSRFRDSRIMLAKARLLVQLSLELLLLRHLPPRIYNEISQTLPLQNVSNSFPAIEFHFRKSSRAEITQTLKRPNKGLSLGLLIKNLRCNWGKKFHTCSARN